MINLLRFSNHYISNECSDNFKLGMSTTVLKAVREKSKFDLSLNEEPTNVGSCSEVKNENKSIPKSNENDTEVPASASDSETKRSVLSSSASSALSSNNNSRATITNNNNNNKTSSTTRVLPLVYIQTPNMLKSASLSTGNTKTMSSFQISTLGTKLNATNTSTLPSVVLTPTGSNTKPIILQKSLNSSNNSTLIPVSVATVSVTTGTKQTYAYFATIANKQTAVGGGGNGNGGICKTTDGHQIVVPTSHLPVGLVPAPTNQKLVLTPMTMPKLTPRLPVTYSTSSGNHPKISNLVLPMALSSQIKNTTSNQSVINFKITNGQIQSDPKGSITVLCDNKPTAFRTTTNEDNDIVDDSDEKTPDVIDDIKIEKPLSEKSYELSIPDHRFPNTKRKADFSYTISIPNDVKKDGIKVQVREDIQSIAVPQHVKQAELQYRKPLHEVSILKKCNLNSIDRRIEASPSRNKVFVTNKAASEASPLDQQQQPTETNNVNIITNATLDTIKPIIIPEVKKVNTERRRKSQYTYLRDYDEVVVTSGNAWENKHSEKFKQFQSAEITFTKLSSVDDDVKEVKDQKSMDDFIEIQLVNQDLPQFCTDDDQVIKTALKWRDGVGFLPGSKLKFHINEFGLIEMLVGDEYEKMKPTKATKDEPTPAPINTASDSILCCSGCGCYGMPSEFICQSYCSRSCKIASMKTETKRAFLAKRKKKKMAMMQKHKSDEPTAKVESVAQLSSTSQQQQQQTGQSDDDNSNDTLHDTKVHNYPWQGGKKGFSWSKYLDHMKAKSAPVKLFKDPFPYAKNSFRPGMKLEGIDPQHPSYFCVMTVSEVQGYRIRLHFDGYPENYDFWVNADSMDIFPVGWCEKFNHMLHPPPHYSLRDFSWTTYLKQCKASAAPRHLFQNRTGNSVCPNGFRLGMKLEAVDKKNASLVCVATVTDQMDNRFLVHFDSWDDIYDYWADPSSPYIHPVGWCDQYGHNLTPPNDYPNPETFTWEKYLKETKSVAAPVRAFKQRPSNGFKRDMRLECVDKRVPALIRVSTVDDVREHQIKIRFDGWPNKYTFWIDDDSADIHPSSWCQKTGHQLESPLTPEDVYEINFECLTVGCRGLGHIKGAKYPTHTTAKDCPYSDENLDAEYVLPDRLTLTDQDFIQESVIPVSREPRDKIKIHRTGRPPKVRRLTAETSVKSEWPPEPEPEDDFSEPCRKRKLSIRSSPVFHEEKIKISEDINCRFKSLVSNEYPTCPSQQVLAKHSKILNDIISNAQGQDPRSWTKEEVADFVNSLPSCRDNFKLFLTHDIDGEALLMLTQKDLTDILKFKLGPAIKLYNSIVMLRHNVSFYN